MCFTINIFGQSISDQSFAIAEFSDSESVEAIFKNKHTHENFGMSIELIQKDSLLTLKLKNGDFLFSNFLTLLKTKLKQDKTETFPLFLKFNGDDSIVEYYLKKSGLLNLVFYQPKGERWPSVADILRNKKQLLIFKETTGKTTFLNNSTNHILNLSDFIKNKATAIGLNNEFLKITRFTTKELATKNTPKDWNSISANPFAIRYLMSKWKITGKHPNFIFYSHQKHASTIYFLTKLLNETPYIKGKVIDENSIVNELNWIHHKKSLTGGYFNFPYYRGGKFILHPLKEGIEFNPNTLTISKTELNKNIVFKSKKLDISNGLTGFYKFDNNLENQIKKEKLAQNTPLYVNDKNKGSVLKIEKQNVIQLNTSDNYDIVNSSFSMAIDFKYSPVATHHNYAILGSNEEGFRKGLHINLLHGKLTFGFYTNDTKLDYYVEPNEWHKLVVTYNIYTQTQSIYLNGELIGSSNNHASYIGTSHLLLGHSIKQQNYFTGYVDNLHIWNRTLSPNEIKWLNSNAITILKTTKETHRYLFLIPIFVLLFSGFIWMYFKRKKNNSIIEIPLRKSEPQKENTIYLFGHFRLLVANGVDLSDRFSPKIKELFLLILLRTLKNNKGISTRELTDILWEGFPPSKAANNRGVSFNVLKKTLKDAKGITVVYENKLWKVNLEKHIFVDYEWVLDFIKSKKTNYPLLFDIVKKGEFLTDAKTDWLLKEKSNLNFDLLDLLILYAKEEFKYKKDSKVIEITNYIQLIDELNIQALYYQLHCLSKLGSKNKVIFLFDTFCEKYEATNAIPFSYTLNDFLQKDIDYLWE
ncbi:two-component SAPR family response regulator [Wenyingzhuangia heitensis]|uniref:Two-component SAPR family response regulator n=1 Tax=Wenyingzhuangia heitensis TaxID=1487859 RepID=A0ABX0UAR9_9FLAO|nr:LamG-like jellyroll fold domain-containing protein [Wenyingzhuangia heitensis]NIJ45919.1 two-component SAPR family response regulator [Wenyingzhuangia heitensis]